MLFLGGILSIPPKTLILPFLMVPKVKPMFDPDHQDTTCDAPSSETQVTQVTHPFHHIPVLLDPVCEWLAPSPGESYLDLTLGGAGHASVIAKMIGKNGRIAGFDRDPTALAAARERLQTIGPKCTFIGASFIDFDQKLREAGFLDRKEGGGFNIVLADFGLSSVQIDDTSRGFSHQVSASLDMRMSQDGMSAETFLATVDETQLADILFQYGDIRQSRRLAKIIVEAAASGALKTTKDLAELSCRVLGQVRYGQPHPATRVFQAIRIAVNDELGAIDALLKHIPRWMKPGGRLAIISFHSGEDRRVKQAFKQWQSPCICPPLLPQCICQKTPKGSIATRKPIVASPEELAQNSRARSAKMRVFRFN